MDLTLSLNTWLKLADEGGIVIMNSEDYHKELTAQLGAKINNHPFYVVPEKQSELKAKPTTRFQWMTTSFPVTAKGS